VKDVRVAYVTGNYNTVVDGVAMIANKQVTALQNAGVPVRIYAPVASSSQIDTHTGKLVPVPSIPFVRPYRLALGLTPFIRQDLTRFNPTLVFLTTPDLLGVGAQEWARRRKIPVVSTFFTHFGSYLPHYNLKWLNPLYIRAARWFYRRCQTVYAPCRSIINALSASGIEANFHEHPFGVDTDRFQPAKRSEAWRTAKGFTRNEVVIAFVGRLVQEKGLQTFVDVIYELRARRIPHRVLIVGEGPAESDLRERLPFAVFTGRLAGDELATAYASADIFLFPSDSETFGLVTLEALASGLATVVADATGSKDIVRNERDGWVVSPSDTLGFANRIENLIRKPDLRKSFSAAGVQRASEYQWPVILDNLVERLIEESVGLSRIGVSTHPRRGVK
jgi:phosphatidylinositol alpha 1,6-mannosyltransferase